MTATHETENTGLCAGTSQGDEEGADPAEEKLWDCLRRNDMMGFKFYRQYPIGRYIADFCCPECNLIIEMDGSIHDTERNRAYDDIRDKTLTLEGMRVLRFENKQIFNDIDAVLKIIQEAL